MFRSPFFWKLYAGYVTLIILTTGIVTLTVAPRIQNESRAEIQKSLWGNAVLVRSISTPELYGSIDPGFPERIRSLGQWIGTRLTVIRADGVVIADSHEDPQRMENHGNRTEILEARRQGSGTAVRFSRTLEQEMMYLALSVEPEGDLLGFVRTALPLTTMNSRLRDFRRTILIGALIAAVTGFGLGILFTRHHIRPLISMTHLVEALARDHSAPPLPHDRSDEIGTLAQSFNRMARELRQRIAMTRQDRRQLLAILGSMQEGVVAVDRQGKVVHMNRVAGRILRVSPEMSVDRPIWEVTRVGEVGQILSRALEEGLEITEEVRWTEPSREQTFQIHVSPFPKDDSDPEGAVAVLHDVTNLRKLESIRREFVANVSHELKTPVTAIQGLVETLQEDRGMDVEVHRRFLEKIRRQTDTLASLLNDLLTLSRIESPDPRLERVSLDLRTIVREAEQTHRGEAELKKIRLETEIPPEAVLVRVDERAVRQALDNLVDNAIKYTPREGRIRLRVRTRNSTALIEVQDNGIGIEPNDQPRIFERFYRVDRARSRQLGGTGLGLSIVKHTATVHGGDVSVESTPGVGSTFRIHLPLEPIPG